ncbi:MAG: 6,7-dimethyl-8-ribityllumazine synthase, partial [Pseudomonadota bacterium]
MAGLTNPNASDPDRFRDLASRAGAQNQIAMIVAPYYSDVSEVLEKDARAVVEAAGFEVIRAEVPGALELPQALQIVALGDNSDSVAGAIMIGCVIRGETSHYDIVCETANRAAMNIAVDLQMPLGNALLTVDTHAQAVERAGGGSGGKGGDAARAVLSLPNCSFSSISDSTARAASPPLPPDPPPARSTACAWVS